MPIYEYRCPKCGVFDAIQKFSDKPLKCKPDCSDPKCPKKAERLISASAFHLKGGGWYKSDYSSGSTSSTSSKDGSTVKDSKTETKSEGKDSDKKGGKGGCGSGCSCH